MSGVLARASILGVTGFLGYYYASKLADVHKWKTHSMEPFIEFGEIVVVDKTTEDFEKHICTYMYKASAILPDFSYFFQQKF